MSLLERAIEIAVTAHKDQVDKASKPYILHPLRLMFKIITFVATLRTMVVGLIQPMLARCLIHSLQPNL